MIKSKPGYAALIVVIVVVTILSTVVFSMVSRSKYSIQGITSAKEKYDSLNFVESCVEEAALYKSRNGNYPSTITLPGGNCTISDAFSSWFYSQFVTEGMQNNKQTRIEVVLWDFFGWLTPHIWYQVE